MTVRANLTQTCDRCLRPFMEHHLQAGDEIPEVLQTGLKVLSVKGVNTSEGTEETLLFSFSDLCPACSEALEGLLARLKLDGKSPSAEGQVVEQAVRSEKPAKKRYRRTKAEMAALRAAEAAGTSTPVEPAPVISEYTEAPVEQAQAAPGNGNGNGNGGKAASTGLVTDPETGDLYNPATGEIVRKGDGVQPF